MPYSTTGFTLLEVVLSIALLGVIGGMGTAVYQSFQVRNDLDIAATTIAQEYRRAAVLAQASDGDTSWGVQIGSSAITLFKGASYATRDVAYDEVFDLPASITPSGVVSVVFSKFTGFPQTTGTTTLVSSTNESRSIVLSAKGTVHF